MNREEVITRCFSFIRSIGIEIAERTIDEKTFVPGITIDQGRLVVDTEKMKYPGDLLHEAGHIAVATPDERQVMQGDATVGKKENEGQELGVLLWSFLAAEHAGIPLEVVFHPDGYRGDSEWLLENFQSGKFIGLPLLEWMKIVHRDESGNLKIIDWVRK